MNSEFIPLQSQHLERVSEHFNQAADTYQAYSHLQQQAGKQLLQCLIPSLPSCGAIIDLGCGDGVLTEQLAIASKHYRLFKAIDIATACLRQAAARLQPYAITLHQADFNQLSSQSCFDLMFANLSLHWSVDLPWTLKRLIHHLTPQGLLAFSIPLKGTLKELANRFHCHDFVDAMAVQTWLIKNGYQVKKTLTEKISLPFETLLSALQTLKKTGTHYVPPQYKYSHRTQRLMKQQLFQATTLTYHLGYWIIGKADKK